MPSTPRVAPSTRRDPHPRLRSRLLVAAALLIGLTLLAAACSSKGYGTSASSTTSTAKAATGDRYGATNGSSTTAAPSGTKTDIGAATTSLGPVVVDSSGFTLYRYTKDTGTTPTCTGGCAGAWPAATVTGTPTKGGDITGAVTVTTAPDGSSQLVLDGHPLYRFAADKAPGDVGGQGIGGVWYAVKADGQNAG